MKYLLFKVKIFLLVEFFSQRQSIVYVYTVCIFAAVCTYIYTHYLYTYDTSIYIYNIYIIYINVYYISQKAVAPHSSTLAWKIPWTEEPGGLQSMGSLRVGYD